MIKKRGLLIVVSGPSGAGKGTICANLLTKKNSIYPSVSTTTREPRKGEIRGINYNYISKEDFEEKIENNQFLEYAKVYDNYYGTPKDFVLEKLSKGEDVLLEIDIQGAIKVREKFPEGIFVFILPPSMAELRNRIVNRGSETKESLEKRFMAAFHEIKLIKKYDYFIVNDKIEDSTRNLVSIIEAEKSRVVKNVDEIIEKFRR
ncbi:guanylate kinase [Clostridiaceae bacterium HSG29]|nr:guanylate kinase [Clostridiaceae bacterium HSG29]